MLLVIFLVFLNMATSGSQHTKEDSKFHKCVDLGEAYSASYLTSKEHLMQINIHRNYSHVSCEMASTIMLATAKRKNVKRLKTFINDPNATGIAIMSIDVLDYSVLHLSAYERLNRKFKKKLRRIDQTFEDNDIEPVKRALSYINHTNGYNGNIDHRSTQTIAIMPFLGLNMGAGHSVLENRFVYLKLCVLSVLKVFSNIAIGVLSADDRDWILKNLKYPIFDVIYLNNLPKSAALPIATLNEAKFRLSTKAPSSTNPSKTWDFNYVYFTESDQILLSRITSRLFDYIDMFPRRMLLPHRLMPYPEIVLSAVHQRRVDRNSSSNLDASSLSCCLPRQNCISRAEWIYVDNENLPVVNIYGLQVPLGNCHFKIERYRHCIIKNRATDKNSEFGSCP